MAGVRSLREARMNMWLRSVVEGARREIEHRRLVEGLGQLVNSLSLGMGLRSREE